MNDQKLLRNRGRINADVDVPAARPGAAGHEEWLIDVGIEETFPASDPPSMVQPGSIAGRGAGKAAARRSPGKAAARRSRGKAASRR
ncbi:MAG: hypothetical protein ACREUX_21480 [Burkholderiales bacterium]